MVPSPLPLPQSHGDKVPCVLRYSSMTKHSACEFACSFFFLTCYDSYEFIVAFPFLQPARSHTSCCPLLLGYRTSNLVEPTSSFPPSHEENHDHPSMSMITADGTYHTLPGSDRGIG